MADRKRSAAVHAANALAARNFANATKGFDPVMLSALPPSKLEMVWESLILQNGQFRNLLPDRKEEIGTYTAFFIPARFERATVDLKIVINPAAKIGGFFIVPHSGGYQTPSYVVTTNFTEMPAKVKSGDFTLDATVTIPKGAGPFPGLVLVHGSGPNDRDETIGPNKPFKDLAEGLASKGIAVLRYEKRTKQWPQKLDKESLTVKEETIDDALAAVNTLRSIDRVNKEMTFLLGHSLGGMLIPRIAKEDESLRGFIIMAGNTRSLGDLLLDQTEYITRLKPSSEARKAADQVKQQVAALAKVTEETPAEQLPFGVPAKYWLDLKNYNPAAEVKAVNRPILLLQGGRDYQVTSADYRQWETALRGDSFNTLKFYPKLNHLFAEGEGMATPDEYMTQSKNVSRVVIDDIAEWINSFSLRRR